MGECIEKSDAPTLKLVLSRGADPNLSYKGLHSIIYAARVGDIEVFRLLIEAGARLFVDPRVAPNAMFEAVGRGHKEIVKFLVERGVSFTSRKPFGKSAIEFAEEKGMTEVLDLLRAYKNNRKQGKPRSNTSRSAKK
jgi:ankyrin repeat protein